MSIHLGMGALITLIVANTAILGTAAERPTFNKETCDPRPDILPSSWVDCSIGEYRRAYNRPRSTLGWLAHTFEPSSREAMVWCEANRSGLYSKPHSTAVCKRFYFPKPWEILDTGPRPDFARPSSPTKFLQTFDETKIDESKNAVPEESPSTNVPGRVSEAKEFSP